MKDYLIEHLLVDKHDHLRPMSVNEVQNLLRSRFVLVVRGLVFIPPRHPNDIRKAISMIEK